MLQFIVEDWLDLVHCHSVARLQQIHWSEKFFNLDWDSGRVNFVRFRFFFRSARPMKLTLLIIQDLFQTGKVVRINRAHIFYFRVGCSKRILQWHCQCIGRGFLLSAHYQSLHHTPLSDIDFELLLFSTVSNQSAWNFACRRDLLISLIARKFFEICWRKVWYPKLVYTQ